MTAVPIHPLPSALTLMPAFSLSREPSQHPVLEGQEGLEAQTRVLKLSHVHPPPGGLVKLAHWVGG